MYNIDNEKIGKHIKELIDKKINEGRFKSHRNFAKECIILRDNITEVSDKTINTMSTHINQLEHGNEGIRILDLPVFSELLGVSIEEILSGGAIKKTVTNRLTCYSIGYSKNPKDWEASIDGERKFLGQFDEYGKCVLDYAIEADNYEFLKYIIEQKYIFVSFRYGDCFYNTHIENNRESGMIFSLQINRFKYYYKMISLAIKNNDIEMLNTFYARENWKLYYFSEYSKFEEEEIEDIDNFEFRKEPQCRQKILEQKILEELSVNKNEKILSFFFEEYEICSKNDEKNKFIFPYAGQLLDMMIKNKNKHVNLCLKKVILHNKYVKNELESIIKNVNKNIDECIEWHKEIDKLNTEARKNKAIRRKTLMNEEEYVKYLEKVKNEDDKIDDSEPNLEPYLSAYKNKIWEHYMLYPKYGFVRYWYYNRIPNECFYRLKSNIINVTAKSDNPETQALIDELNETYNYFLNCNKEVE